MFIFIDYFKNTSCFSWENESSYVNQDESLTYLQTKIKYSFLLNFLHDSLMNLRSLFTRIDINFVVSWWWWWNICWTSGISTTLSAIDGQDYVSTTSSFKREAFNVSAAATFWRQTLKFFIGCCQKTVGDLKPNKCPVLVGL